MGISLHVVTRHDVENVAAAFDRPKQIGIAVPVDLKDLTLARKQFEIQHIIASRAVLIAQMTDTVTQNKGTPHQINANTNDIQVLWD